MEESRRANREKKKQNVIKQMLKYFAPYWVVTFIIAFILIMLASVIYIITPMTQGALPAISRTIFIVSELFVASIAGKVAKSLPIVMGAIYGLGVALILLFIGLITSGVGLFTLEFLFILLTGILIGMLGAYLGKNFFPDKKRKKISFK